MWSSLSHYSGYLLHGAAGSGAQGKSRDDGGKHGRQSIWLGQDFARPSESAKVFGWYLRINLALDGGVLGLDHVAWWTGGDAEKIRLF